MAFDAVSWLRKPSGATDKEISAVESAIAKRFPEDFRLFARSFAGGIPSSKTDFEFTEHDGNIFHAGLGVFLSFTSGEDYNLLDAMHMVAEWLPKNLVPVAEGPGGDYICLDYRKSDRPCISFWKHDRSGFPNEVSFVSESFNDFLNLLHDPVDVE